LNLLFDERREICLGVTNRAAVQSAQAQVRRARCAGGRRAKCLAHEIGQPLYVVDLRAELGHGVELIEIFDFLVSVAIARPRHGAAADRNHRRACHEAVAQTRREIRGADLLRHADAGLAACARVTVGHISRGLFAVRHDFVDLEIIHFRERAHEYRRNVKHMRDAVAMDDFGEQSRAAHFCHYRISPTKLIAIQST
jgi:hypothetical protein